MFVRRVIWNKIAHSNIDCIRGNRPPMINLPIYFIMLFFLCEYTGRMNQNMRGQENSTTCLIFFTNSGDLLPQSHRSHPGCCGGHEQLWPPQWLWQVHHSSSEWSPGIFVSKPYCFQIKHLFFLVIWTLPLFLDHLALGHWTQKKGHSYVLVRPDAYASHRDIVLPISCRLLAVQKTNLSPFFFSPPSLSYLTLSFSPFASILLSSQQHSSVSGFILSKPMQELFFS